MIETWNTESMRDMIRSGLKLEGPIELLAISQNYVYSAFHDGLPVIVRCSPPGWRSVEQIDFEVELLDVLASAGLSVCKALSIEGRLITALHLKESVWLTVVFQKAKGKALWEGSPKEGTVREVGKYIGTLHTAGSPLIHRAASQREFSESDQRLLSDTGDGVLIRKGYEISNALSKMSHSKSDYGLVHADIHSGNVFVEDTTVTLIDFDNVRLGWYFSDLLNLLYEFQMNQSGNAATLAAALYAGYAEIASLGQMGQELIELLIREADISEIVSIRNRGIDQEMKSTRYQKLMDCIMSGIPSFLPYKWY